MKSILLTIGLSIGLLLASFSFVFAQTYSYNFGTTEATHTSGASTTFFSDTPTNGGTYRVRIGAGAGNFSLVNPGSSLGTGNEGVLTAATSTSANKFGIYDWAEATSALHLKFKFRTTSSTNGNLVVYVGNSTPGSDNQGYTGSYSNSLAIFWISYSSGNLNTVNRRQLGSNTTITGSGFAKDTDHDVEIFANNAASTASYTKGETNYTLAAQSWDLWVDGVKVSPANGWARANNPGLASGNITGFGFFAESSTSNAAQIILDDLEYSPVLPFVAPTEPTISSTLANVTKRNYAFGGGPSATSTFNVSGSNLTGNVTLTPSANIEVSLSDGGSFSATNPISLAGTGGTLNATPVYVRLKAGLAEASYASENITIQTTGADDVVVNASGKVYDAFAINYSNNLRLEDEVDRAQAQGFTLSNAVFNPAADGRIDISVNGFVQSPSFDLSDFDALEVSFGLQNFGLSSNRVLTLQLSSNDGETYSDLGEFSINSSSQIVSTTTVDLSAFTTTTLGKLRFTMTGGPMGIRFRDLSITEAVNISANITGVEGYRFLSTPVTTTFASFLTPIWTQGATGADTEFGSPNVFTWNNTSTTDDAGNWVGVTNLNQNIGAGTGFMVFVYADDNYDGSADAFPKVLNVSGVQHANDTAPTVNTNADGWTLLGNPFAETIRFGNVGKSNLRNTLYVWDSNHTTGTGHSGSNNPGAGTWRTHGGGNGDQTGDVAPFQAFFVQNTGSGNGTVQFGSGARQGSGGNFHGKDASPSAVRMELIGDGFFNSAWVAFGEAGSLELTYNDTYELMPLSMEYALFGTQKSGKAVDVGHYPANDFDDYVIPVVAEASRAGDFSINVTDFSLPEGLNLTFVDTFTGEEIAMNGNFSYNFSITQVAKRNRNHLEQFAKSGPVVAEASASESRFLIKVSRAGTTSIETGGIDAPLVTELYGNYPNPFNPTTRIQYALPFATQVRLEVFDLMGRRVALLVDGEQRAGSQFVTFDASALSSGVYVYRLTAAGQTLTQKMTLVK